MSVHQDPNESTDANHAFDGLCACAHHPRCPEAESTDREAAHVIAAHPEQGWSLLCNGVVLFEDSGELLPSGRCVNARRAELTAAARHR